MEIVFFQPLLGQIMGQPSKKQANVVGCVVILVLAIDQWL